MNPCEPTKSHIRNKETSTPKPDPKEESFPIDISPVVGQLLPEEKLIALIDYRPFANEYQFRPPNSQSNIIIIPLSEPELIDISNLKFSFHGEDTEHFSPTVDKFGIMMRMWNNIKRMMTKFRNLYKHLMNCQLEKKYSRIIYQWSVRSLNVQTWNAISSTFNGYFEGYNSGIC